MHPGMYLAKVIVCTCLQKSNRKCSWRSWKELLSFRN